MCVCMCPNTTSHNFTGKTWNNKLKNLCYLEKFLQGKRNYLEQETDMKVISSCTGSVNDNLLLKSFPANQEKML